jgi:hypothetical protein
VVSRDRAPVSNGNQKFPRDSWKCNAPRRALNRTVVATPSGCRKMSRPWAKEGEAPVGRGCLVVDLRGKVLLGCQCGQRATSLYPRRLVRYVCAVACTLTLSRGQLSLHLSVRTGAQWVGVLTRWCRNSGC